MPETTTALYSSHNSPHKPAPVTPASCAALGRDADDDRRRLAALVGLPCPRCGQGMVLTGPADRPRLVCSQIFGYRSECSCSYSNVEAAEDELRPH